MIWVHKVGDHIRCPYNNPPVAESTQFALGAEVQIIDDSTKQVIAVGKCVETDENACILLITWVC